MNFLTAAFLCIHRMVYAPNAVKQRISSLDS